MHLVLGHPDDLCCAGVLSRLEARGLEVRIVQEPLATPARLTWRLDAAGVTSSLYPGRPDTEIGGVLVRDTGMLDPEGWDPADHSYMQAEFRAALLAWLASLACPVINRPIASHWYGTGAPMFAWRNLLHRSGLRVPELVVTNDPSEAMAFRRRLAVDRVAGAIYVPLTGAAGYLLGDEEAWERLAVLQKQTPVCISEPHGPVTLACVVGDDVIWDGPPPSEAPDLRLALARFAAAARLAFVEIALAPVRRGTAVVLVEPQPQLEHFTEGARSRILDALAALFVPVSSPDASRIAA